jgi:hypothetical protein
MQTYNDYQEISKAYRETNDCTVRGLASLFNCSYGLAHRKLKKWGRPYRRGASWSTVERATEELSRITGKGVKVGGYPQMLASTARLYGHKALTINQFIKQHPRGVFLLSMRGHVATLRDGVLYDHTQGSSKRRLVVGYYRIKED